MRILAILLSLAPLWICAQVSIYPSLNKENLLSALVEDYKPAELMTYGPTRDTMYKHVYRDTNGYVSCYYTGHAILLPEDVDPSAFLYMNGADLGITAEHIYPQSKGASEGSARTDMHALVPAIWRANESRSNYPFGEVPDAETDHWFALDADLTDLPQDNIDDYSELLNGGFGTPGLFEPRESVKGDIARAVFYFYTMYKNQADEADPDYFDEMKDVLAEWHTQDPVDSLEFNLNQKKARYQNGKLNPFILDCTLVSRAYFDGSEVNCMGAFSSDTDDISIENRVRLFPNPASEFVNVSSGYTIDRITITDTSGKELWNQAAHKEASIDISALNKGLYFLRVKTVAGIFSHLLLKN